MRKMISLESIILKAKNREKQGIKEYGIDSYKNLDLFNEIEEELLDVIVYAYLEICKLYELKRKVDFYENK
jgi:hypothetical protein